MAVEESAPRCHFDFNLPVPPFEISDIIYITKAKR